MLALHGWLDRWTQPPVPEAVAVPVAVAPAIDPLVEALRRGDDGAVARAYDHHEATVRAFARRLVGDEDAAEDLVQEVFVSLPSAIKRFRGEAQLATFLVSVAVNHARHHVRAATRRRRAMERYAAEPSRSMGSDPERSLAERQLATAVSRALDTLPWDQRVAFVLCDVEERTAPEAAALVKAPEATVRTRLFHARRKLREQLDAEGFHDPR